MDNYKKYRYYKNLYKKHLAGSSKDETINNIKCHKIITMNLAGAQENPFEFLEQPFTILPNEILNGIIGSEDTIREVLSSLPSFLKGVQKICLQSKDTSKSNELDNIFLDLKIVDFFNLLKKNEDLIKKIDSKTKKAPTLLYTAKEFCDNRWWTNDLWETKLTSFILSKKTEFDKNPLKENKLKEIDGLNMDKLNENIMTNPGRMMVFFLFHSFIIFSFVKALENEKYNKDVLQYFSSLTKEFGESTRIFQNKWYQENSKDILLLQEAQNADGSIDTSIYLPKKKNDELIIDCSSICNKIVEVKKTKKNIELGKGNVYLDDKKICCRGPILINSKGPVYLFSVHAPSDGETTNNIITEINNHFIEKNTSNNITYIIGIDSNVKDNQAIIFIKHFINLGWTSAMDLQSITGKDNILVKSNDNLTMLDNYEKMVQNISGDLNGPWDKNQGGGFTVNKERTLFQSQINKANKPDKNLKDFILVKGDLSKFILENSWGATIKNGIFEGEMQPDIFSSNQPSDHFAVELNIR